MKLCILKTFFQSQQHSEGKAGLKNRTTVSTEEAVLYCINIGSKLVDLFYLLPCTEKVHFKHQTKPWGSPVHIYSAIYTPKIATFKRGA